MPISQESNTAGESIALDVPGLIVDIEKKIQAGENKAALGLIELLNQHADATNDGALLSKVLTLTKSAMGGEL